MLGIIGLGQAGSNLASEAAKRGVLTGAINFSQRDLDAVEVKHKLRLLGSEGVGKQRNEAIRLFQEQWETAVGFVRDNFSNCKLIALTFSSSGGSGSGIAPILLDMLIQMFPEKVFIALVIMPEISESETSQKNCIATFEELSGLDLAVFPVDNQQIRLQNPSIGKNRLYEISNLQSVDTICRLVGYTEKHSKTGNFDEKDLLTTLRTRGIAIITETPISTSLTQVNLTVDGISEKVNSSWAHSVFAPLSSDSIQRAAIVFDGQEELMSFLQVSNWFKDFKVKPHEIFEGYYHEQRGNVMTLLTGLKWSFSRLKDIESSLEHKHDESEVSLEQGYKSSVSLRQPIKKQEKKVSVMDILNKYNR